MLTEQGLEKLREASGSHVADIRELFEGRFAEKELEQLVRLLGRLPQAASAACGAD